MKFSISLFVLVAAFILFTNPALAVEQNSSQSRGLFFAQAAELIKQLQLRISDLRLRINEATAIKNLISIQKVSNQPITAIPPQPSSSIAPIAPISLLAPIAPSNLSISSPGVASVFVSLVWSDNADNEDGYVIERSLNSSINFVPIVNLPADAFFVFDTSVTGNTLYYYRIKAFNGNGSSYSAAQSILTPSPAPTAPTPPSNLTATPISYSSVQLTWHDNSTNEVQFYVMRGTDPWSHSTVVFVPPNPGTGTMTAIDNTAVGNTRYWYQIAADPAPTYSNKVDIVTPPNLMSPSLPPLAPPFFNQYGVASVPPGIPKVILIWENVANEINYKVERSINNTSNFIQIGTAQGVPPIGYFLDGVIVSGTTYYYRVRAYNQYGNSPYTQTGPIYVP